MVGCKKHMQEVMTGRDAQLLGRVISTSVFVFRDLVGCFKPRGNFSKAGRPLCPPKLGCVHGHLQYCPCFFFFFFDFFVLVVLLIDKVEISQSPSVVELWFFFRPFLILFL